MESIRWCGQPYSSGGLMSAYRKYKPHDLQAWLIFATVELTIPVKKRIQLEINEHYAEAVAAYIREGLSEPDARRKALAELGDPHESAKRFRKQHLNILDSNRFKAFLREPHSVDPLLYMCGLIFVLLMGNQFKLIHIISVYAASFFAAIIIPCIGKVIARRRRISLFFLFFLLRIATWAILLGLCYFMFGASLILVGFCGAFAISFLYELTLWLKLRHIANVWDEIDLKND
jgi:hypothetical protein